MMKIKIDCSYCGINLIEEKWVSDKYQMPIFPSICGLHTCGNCEDTAKKLLEEYNKLSKEEKVKIQEKFYHKQYGTK